MRIFFFLNHNLNRIASLASLKFLFLRNYVSLPKEDVFREDIHAVSAVVKTESALCKGYCLAKKEQTVFVTAVKYCSQRGDRNMFAEHTAHL